MMQTEIDDAYIRRCLNTSTQPMAFYGGALQKALESFSMLNPRKRSK